MITASLSLADIPGTVRLWRQRKTECLLSLAAFLGVALLGVLPGIAIAVGLSILNVFRRAWWPYDTELGRVEGLRAITTCTPTRRPGTCPAWSSTGSTARCSSPMPPPSGDEIRRMARALPPPRWIVIAAEPVTDVDTTAADMLEDLDEALNDQGISLVFAELKDPVRRKIERYGLTRTINPNHFFPTIETALAAFREETGAEWTVDGGAEASGQATPGRRRHPVPRNHPRMGDDTPAEVGLTRRGRSSRTAWGCAAGAGRAGRSRRAAAVWAA